MVWQYAEIILTQSYHNISNKAIGATYHLPIEDGAAVCGFQAKYPDGHTVEGVLQEKNQARQSYEQDKQQGQHAN